MRTTARWRWGRLRDCSDGVGEGAGEFKDVGNGVVVAGESPAEVQC